MEKFGITLEGNERQVTAASVLQLETNVLDTISKEETANMARAEEKAKEDEMTSLNRQMGDSFCDIVVSFFRIFGKPDNYIYIGSLLIYNKISSLGKLSVVFWLTQKIYLVNYRSLSFVQDIWF